ncbi:hypothetical protein FQN57_002123 [Myotisia sp. PD_48]|nr:hypothetical protein FQN57_002123 [Myotisia sp. PD_48]
MHNGIILQVLELAKGVPNSTIFSVIGHLDSCGNINRYNWNACEDFFSFTRGHFVLDEVDQMARRHIRFNMNELVHIAAESVGAKSCVDVEKCPDGMYNKSFVLTMDDGQEVIAKVPNPNAGVSYFTTASEVATMDFVRNVLGTPAPNFGSLYYAKDLATSQQQNHLYSDNTGRKFWDERFAIGPATGREWFDYGRSCLPYDRGPWQSVYEYYGAIGRREKMAISTRTTLPKQTIMVCGPGLYQAERSKKLSTVEGYLRIFDALLPTENKSITTPCLWHDDLHDENIFVDPNDPSKVVGIIDWQSVNLLPLLDHDPDPAFVDYHGPKPETLDRPELQDLEGLSDVERSEAIRQCFEKALFVASRRISLKKTPAAYEAIKYQRTDAFNLLVVARCMARSTGKKGSKSPRPFPITFDNKRLAQIEEDSEKVTRGMQIMNDSKARLGPLWPDKDAVEHGQYELAKAALRALKEEVVQDIGKTDGDKAELARQWPFDD